MKSPQETFMRENTAKLKIVSVAEEVPDSIRRIWGDESSLDDALARAFTPESNRVSTFAGLFEDESDSGYFAAVMRMEQPPAHHARFGYFRAPVFSKRSAEMLSGGYVASDTDHLLRGVERLGRAVFESPDVDRLVLHRMRGEDVEHLTGELGALGFGVWKSRVVHTLRIRETKEATITHLKKKRRYNLNRQLSKILAGESESSILTFRSPAEIEEYIERSGPVQARTYQNQLTKTTANSEQLQTILRQDASDGAAICFILEIDGEVAAFQKGVRRGTSYSLQELGFDRRYEQLSPGMSLLYASFDTLADQGVSILDFGSGEAQYKSVLTSGNSTIWSFVRFGPRLRAKVDAKVFKAMVASDRLLKACVGSRLTKVARRSWRNAVAKSTAGKVAKVGSEGP